MPGRRGEAGLAGRNGRFPDEPLALVKIGALVRNADNDFGRTGDAVAIPVAWRRGGCRRDRRRRLGFHFGAADDERERKQSENSSKKRRTGHRDAQSNASRSLFNTKDLASARA